jgi:hypothetical protein
MATSPALCHRNTCRGFATRTQGPPEIDVALVALTAAARRNRCTAAPRLITAPSIGYQDGILSIWESRVASRSRRPGRYRLTLPQKTCGNPYAIDDCAEAVVKALHMSDEEQSTRMRALQSVVAEFNTYRWEESSWQMRHVYGQTGCSAAGSPDSMAAGTFAFLAARGANRHGLRGTEDFCHRDTKTRENTVTK